MKLEKEKIYVVAVSGGPDSVFLLHWLLSEGYHHLVLAHVNYHWRKESDADQKLVEALGKKFNLPVEIKNLDARQIKPARANFEGWARRERYNFFTSLTKKYGSSFVVVGHHENDLIETYLMQKERGNIVKHFGLKSLSSHGPLIVWRPLLQYKKSEILNWLRWNDVEYVLDQTNFDLTLKRNRIRHRLKEDDFIHLHQEILEANQKNQAHSLVTSNYLKTHQEKENLFLSSELRSWSSEQIQHLIYQFFENQKFPNALLGRKRRLLAEIAQRISKSNKNFWFIKLDNHLLIKDYDFLRILTQEELPPSKILVNSLSDLAHLEKFDNKQKIKEIIQSHNHFPYLIYVLEPSQIQGLKWGGKSLAHVLSKQRISYKKRLRTGIIYNVEQKKILDKWAW